MNKRLVVSLVILIVYMTIIMVGAKIEVGGGTMSQAEMVSRQVSYSLVVALVFLFSIVAFFGWRRNVGLRLARSSKSLLILWLPVLFILCFFSIGLLLGLPSPQAMIFIGINTLIVGITEELAFRGILFSGARSALRPIGAIALTSVIFGSVHVLNAFTTGDWIGAAVQAGAASMSGLLFIAILIRTGSIVPAMIIHWLWDFGVFTLGARSGRGEAAPLAEAGMMTLLMPILFVMPNFLYALWLLRGVGAKSSEELLD